MDILRSVTSGRYYVGHAEDLGKRLEKHNRGCVTSTKDRRPWELFYSEAFSTRTKAKRRERQVKQMKSRAWIEQLARASR